MDRSWMYDLIEEAHRLVDAERASKGLPPWDWKQRRSFTLDELIARLREEQTIVEP